jgi:hypothetical protein
VRGAARRNGPTERRDRAAGRLHHDRVGRTSVKNADQFKTKIIGALRRLQNMPHIVRAFFGDPELQYITA